MGAGLGAQGPKATGRSRKSPEPVGSPGPLSLVCVTQTYVSATLHRLQVRPPAPRALTVTWGSLDPCHGSSADMQRQRGLFESRHCRLAEEETVRRQRGN